MPQSSGRTTRRKRRGLPPDGLLPTKFPAPIGSVRTHKGYRLVKQPNHHRANSYGWVFEHILAAERKYGFPITREYTVHHRNRNRGDNRFENLELRLGNHGRGGDALHVLLAQHEFQLEAADILRGFGWNVIAPPTPVAPEFSSVDQLAS